MGTRTARPIPDEPLATSPDALRDLDWIIGTWRSSGRTIATPGAPAIEISGTDRYERAADRAAIVHHVDVRMGPDRMRAVELFGSWDEDAGAFRARSIAADGTEELMHLRGADRHWTITGTDARTELRASDDGVHTDARWERLDDDGAWRHWMDMSFELDANDAGA